MPTETGPDLGQVITWVLSIIAIIGTLFGVIWTASRNRATGKEANGINQFQALIDGYQGQITIYQTQVAELNTRVGGLETRVANAESLAQSQKSELRRVKKVVQDWFRVIRAEWTKITDQPMPLPSPEDMDLLELTTPP